MVIEKFENTNSLVIFFNELFRLIMTLANTLTIIIMIARKWQQMNAMRIRML